MSVHPAIRDALRPLLRRKGITIIVILTLALGVGVNAGVFSVFHQILLQELAVPNAEQIVVFDSPGPRSEWVSNDSTGPHQQVFSYPLFEDLRSATETLDGVATFRAFGVNWVRGARRPAAGGCWFPATISRCLNSSPRSVDFSVVTRLKPRARRASRCLAMLCGETALAAIHR